MATTRTTKKKAIHPTVFEKLKEDHRKVESLFKKMMKAEDDEEEKIRLFEEIRSELEAHAQAEEKLFYPRTEENESTYDLTLEAHEEHRLVKQLLEELEEMDKSSDQWMAKANVLKELVNHHVEEEESKLFPKSKKIFPRDEAIQLAEDVQLEEDRVKEEMGEQSAA